MKSKFAFSRSVGLACTLVLLSSCTARNSNPQPTAQNRVLTAPTGASVVAEPEETIVGTLDYGPVRVATGTMGYKHKEANTEVTLDELSAPNFLLKIIPHVDGSARICELVEYHLEDIDLKGVWTGPGALSLGAHALAPVADLPVLEVVSTSHLVADLTLGLGTVVHDYLASARRQDAKPVDRLAANF